METPILGKIQEIIGLIWRKHQSITFGELSRQVGVVAGGLKDLDLHKGDTAFVFVPPSVEMYLAMFAVIRLGGIAVFLDSWARREELAACAADVEPRCLIAASRALPQLLASLSVAKNPLSSEIKNLRHSTAVDARPRYAVLQR